MPSSDLTKADIESMLTELTTCARNRNPIRFGEILYTLKHSPSFSIEEYLDELSMHLKSPPHDKDLSKAINSFRKLPLNQRGLYNLEKFLKLHYNPNVAQEHRLSDFFVKAICQDRQLVKAFDEFKTVDENKNFINQFKEAAYFVVGVISYIFAAIAVSRPLLITNLTDTRLLDFGLFAAGDNAFKKIDELANEREEGKLKKSTLKTALIGELFIIEAYLQGGRQKALPPKKQIHQITDEHINKAVEIATKSGKKAKPDPKRTSINIDRPSHPTKRGPVSSYKKIGRR